MHQRETRKPRLFGDRDTPRTERGRVPPAIGAVTDPSSPGVAGSHRLHELRLDDVRAAPPILLLLSRR